MRAIPTIALLVLIAACTGPDAAVLVEVDGRAIRVDEFRASYVDYLARTGLPDEPRRRAAHLERLVSMELVRREALDRGLAETAAYRHAEERAKRRLLVDAWLWHAGFDTVTVDEADLEELFVRVNTQVTARHLYAPTREAAGRLVERIEGGETFETLAVEVFADPALASTGGSVGTFGFDEMDPAFEDAAFSLPVGVVSQPVRTAQGWSVIRVDDRSIRPALSESDFAGRRGQLAAFAFERERDRIRRQIMEATWQQTAPTLDQETVSDLLAVLGPGVEAAESDGPDLTAELVRFSVDGRTETWTVGEFLDAAEYTDDSQREAVRDPRSFEAFASGLVVRDVLMRRARAERLDRSDRYVEALDAAMDEWVYERGYERIASSAPVPEDSIRAYFDLHGDDLLVPERVVLREIVVGSAATADSLRAALDGASFEELARRHSISTGTAADGGRLGPLSRADLGPLADRVFDAPVGAVIGPVPVRGRHMLLEVGYHEPARPATLDEVRSDIEATLRRTHRARLVREHATRLRDLYHVRYPDVDLAALPLEAEPVVSS